MIHTKPPHHPNLLSEEDHQIWTMVVSDVRPLDLLRQLIPIAPRQDTKVMVAPKKFKIISALPLPIPLRPKKLHSLAPLNHSWADNIDSSLQKRFRQGKLPVEASLDLHGMTQDQAHHSLLSFVPNCSRQRKRCVNIITGKGKAGDGVLKNQVPRWLNNAPLRELILAFTYARPHHGGEGALYLLLKK